MTLDGRTVIVSGVGSGLGREIAAVVLREGGRAVLGARTEATLAEVASGLDPTGERVAWAVTDITKPGDAEALVALAVERFGAVDGLVNSAAFDRAFGGLETADFDVWQVAVDTNILGTMRMTKAAIEPLGRRGGAIVLIGTQSSLFPRIPQTAYAVSKGALFSATVNLAVELGPRKVRVNSVVPTWMWGPAVEGYVQSVATSRGVGVDTVAGEIAESMPLGEIPTDGDVAEAVGFLLSDRARMISGQILLVNAGEYFR